MDREKTYSLEEVTQQAKSQLAGKFDSLDVRRLESGAYTLGGRAFASTVEEAFYWTSDRNVVTSCISALYAIVDLDTAGILSAEMRKFMRFVHDKDKIVKFNRLVAEIGKKRPYLNTGIYNFIDLRRFPPRNNEKAVDALFARMRRFAAGDAPGFLPRKQED